MLASRDNVIARATAYWDDGGFVEDLCRRVSVPTESQELAQLPELYRYLSEEMEPVFRRISEPVRKLSC